MTDPAGCEEPGTYSELFELIQQTDPLVYIGQSTDLNTVFTVIATFSPDFLHITISITFETPSNPPTTIDLGSRLVQHHQPLDTGPLSEVGEERGGRLVLSHTTTCPNAIGPYDFVECDGEFPTYQNSETGWWVWNDGSGTWIVSPMPGDLERYYWTDKGGQKPPVRAQLFPGGDCETRARFRGRPPFYPQVTVQITQ